MNLFIFQSIHQRNSFNLLFIFPTHKKYKNYLKCSDKLGCISWLILFCFQSIINDFTLLKKLHFINVSCDLLFTEYFLYNINILLIKILNTGWLMLWTLVFQLSNNQNPSVFIIILLHNILNKPMTIIFSHVFPTSIFQVS